MELVSTTRSLSLIYNQHEDRLIMTTTLSSGERRALLLTRSLTGRLVNGLAGLLKRSSKVAARAPDEMRDDLVLLEHQGAVSSLSGGHSASRMTQPASGEKQLPLQPETLPAILVTSISVQTRPTHFEFVFKAGKQAIARFDPNRSELHRLLRLLIRKTEEADWRLDLQSDWLEADKSTWAVN